MDHFLEIYVYFQGFVDIQIVLDAYADSVKDTWMLYGSFFRNISILFKDTNIVIPVRRIF